MFQNFIQKQHNDAMETGDHFKNGASLKSLMSRDNLKFLFFVTLSVIVFVGCVDKKYDFVGESRSRATSGTLTIVRSKESKKFGIIDNNKNEVVSCKYDTIYFNDWNWTIVKLNNKYGSINRENGNESLPCIYDEFGECVIVMRQEQARREALTLMKVKLNDKYGLIDWKGTEIIPVIYDDELIVVDLDIIKVKLNGKYGFIDVNGNTILPAIYDKIEECPSEQNKAGIALQKGGNFVAMTFSNSKIKYNAGFAGNMAKGIFAVDADDPSKSIPVRIQLLQADDNQFVAIIIFEPDVSEKYVLVGFKGLESNSMAEFVTPQLFYIVEIISEQDEIADVKIVDERPYLLHHSQLENAPITILSN